MQNQHLRPHGFQKPPCLKKRHILKPQGGGGKIQIGRSSAQHRTQEVIQKQECHYVEQGTYRPKGQHKPPQRPARPIPRRQGFFFIHVVPGQNDAQNVVQQIQQQNLHGGHWQKRQKGAGADNGEDVAEVGAGGNFNVFEHIGKGLAPF